MPYAVPAPSLPSPSSSAISLAPAPVRPNHRRTRSSFTDESGPGAFVSLGALPKRRPTSAKKAVFHLNPDDSPNEDFNDNDAPSSAPPASTRFTTGAYPPLNSLKFSRESGRFSPSVNPPSHIDIPPMSAPVVPNASASSTASVPFPTSSPLPSPS
ncbi:hypothetical protein EIP91_011849, partial [Steccherinum ochraceum]